MVNFATPLNDRLISPLQKLNQHKRESIIIYLTFVMRVASINDEYTNESKIFYRNLTSLLDVSQHSLNLRINNEVDTIGILERDFRSLTLEERRNVFFISYLYTFVNCEGEIPVKIEDDISELAEQILNFDSTAQQIYLLQIDFFI